MLELTIPEQKARVRRMSDSQLVRELWDVRSGVLELKSDLDRRMELVDAAVEEAVRRWVPAHERLWSELDEESADAR